MRGIVWDNFVSVMIPSAEQKVATEANGRVLNYLGGGELHSCGPCLGRIDEVAMANPGLRSFEVIFADQAKTKTTAYLRELKRECQGRVVLNIIGMVWHDENFTVDFVLEMNAGGGVLFTGMGGSE